MKKSILNIALIAIITLGAISCNNKTKENISKEVDKVAEAGEMASNFTVNTAESKIFWKGSKPMGTHNGTIELASGTIAVAIKTSRQENSLLI